MRRTDREIKDFNEIIEVMKKCDVCRLALNRHCQQEQKSIDDECYPYIVPLNFGMTVNDGTVTLYFHSALEGTKLDLIRCDNRASFEMDCEHELVTEEEHGNCTMNYKSVIGRGMIEFVPDEEKFNALKILMKHYHKEYFPFNEKMIPQTAVFKLTVSEMTGKKRLKTM